MTSKVFISGTVLSLLALASGFNLPSTHRAIATTTSGSRVANPRSPSSSQLFMSSEVEKLRAAAAKAREEYERLSKEMGKEISPSGTMTATTTAATPKKNLSFNDVQALAKSIDFNSGDATSQSSALDNLVNSGDFSLWKSAIRRGPTTTSSSMSFLVPFPVTLQTLEKRTDGKITGPSLGIGGEGDVKFEDFRDLTVVVVLGSTLLGILSLAVLPPNIGATFTYLFALIPVGFIGIGSVAPGIIAGAITAARGKGSEDAELKRERICRHEAGHFLCGYMCGLPVKSYEINSDTGVACVEFHTTGSAAGQQQQSLSEEDIATLSVVAMSGSVAEIMAYDKASGGENDLLELQNSFRKCKTFIGAAKQQDLTRWGALTSYSLIKSNMSKYEGLVNAFKDNKSLAECVSIIEGTA
ncbi:hypothetical protein ACHAWU_007280 [Discostella pseudostelligera]|uniref:Uncharacterized protein n=1 Tax=Discostella pseudostelligera TaxID=259834 RepID=A0ABD3M0R8_9STRA